MNPAEEIYDFVIIGSGIGGLECAYILASEGYSVKVLEKNHQIGGNLQVFSREKTILDTGVHYIGSLEEGECLNQYFKYFQLRDSLKWHKLDDDCFDMISFDDGKQYKLGQGYDQFKANLLEYFPEEREAIDIYCEKLQDICHKFPLYNLDSKPAEDYISDIEALSVRATDFLDSITDNSRLKAVLAGNNALYAGEKEITPLYVHALIANSFIMGSYRLEDGGSQIAINLMRSIQKMGGKVERKKNVVGANYFDDGKIKEVILKEGETVKGKNFISNVHPAVTIDIFGENRFLKAYANRIKNLDNTISCFLIHLILKKDSFKYINYNIYHHANDDVWDGPNYNEGNWAENIFICTPKSSKSDTYADSMTVMAYMKHEEVEKWKNTMNTIKEPGDRGAEYDAFKKEKEDFLLKKLDTIFPNINDHIQSVYSSSPLTFRDYIGDYEGSVYGIKKDANSPLRSIIKSKTKIPNLFLTGQNLVLHGILGTTIAAFLTCFNFVDKEKLMTKVNAIK